jgi:hypothetical protein
MASPFFQKKWLWGFPVALVFFLIFALPLFSHAGITGIFIPTGPSCGQGIIPDDSDLATPIVCPYCPNEGTTKVKLKWELTDRTYTDPVCSVSCKTKENKSCGIINYKDQEEIASGPISPQIKLKAKDELYLTTYKDGQTYQVSCCERCKASSPEEAKQKCLLGICENKTFEASAKTKLKFDCFSCPERKFQDIVGSLNDYQPTKISEKNLSGWSMPDDLDLASNQGSGDRNDVVGAVDEAQCNNFTSDVTDQNFGKDGAKAFAVFEDLKASSLKKDAIPLLLFLRNLPDNPSGNEGFHAVISLGIKETGNGNFRLSLLDPNYGLKEIDCSTYHLPIAFARTASGSLRIVDTPGAYQFTYGCTYTPGQVVVLLRDDFYSYRLRNLLSAAVRTDTASYLKDLQNSLSFLNTGTVVNPKGVCGGWTDFVLKVAYLGIFDEEGRDCHPNGTFSQDKSKNFLAQIFSPLSALLNTYFSPI